MASSELLPSCSERLVDATSSLVLAIQLKVLPTTQKEIYEFKDDIVKPSGLLPLSTDDIEWFIYNINFHLKDSKSWASITQQHLNDIKLQWPAISKMTDRDIDSHDNLYGGLWTLFHHLILSFPKDTDRVAEAIKGFVKHLISCQTCNYHFMRMWDFYDNGRKQIWGPHGADDAALWLWRAHNAATLNQESKGEMDNVNLWPSEFLCPKCTEGISYYGIPYWNEAEVLKVLKLEYGCGINKRGHYFKPLPFLPIYFPSVVIVFMIVLFCACVYMKRRKSSNSAGPLRGLSGGSSSKTRPSFPSGYVRKNNNGIFGSRWNRGGPSFSSSSKNTESELIV